MKINSDSVDLSADGCNENNVHDYDDGDAGGADDHDNDDVGVVVSLFLSPWAPVVRLRRWTG